jgi:hypothetical protein
MHRTAAFVVGTAMTVLSRPPAILLVSMRLLMASPTQFLAHGQRSLQQATALRAASGARRSPGMNFGQRSQCTIVCAHIRWLRADERQADH